jgi:dihydrofolate synthase/folylpolyglutamate synthase
LQSQLPVTRAAIDNGLKQVSLPGRIQIFNGPVTEIYDVSHNPAAIAYLSQHLNTLSCIGKTHAVFSMLADKDLIGSLQAIRHLIDVWYTAPLTVKRAASKAALTEAFQHIEINNVVFFSSIQEAYDAAKRNAHKNDRIIVFGSFHTVADVCKHSGKNL